MFEKPQIDALFGELRAEWKGKPDYEQIHRDVDLGIAFYDAGRSYQDEGLDDRAIALIEKHKPA